MSKDKVFNRKQSRSWIIVINNYTIEDENLLNDLEGVSYMVYGKEIGESGTPHIQGMITFKKQQRGAAVKKIHNTAHWEPCMAADASANYCMKDKKYTIRDHRNQGKRNDIAIIKDVIKEIKDDMKDGFSKIDSTLGVLFKKIDHLNEK